MYEASIGVFSRYLDNLSAILDLAESHVEAQQIDPAMLLQSRLHPTMYDLSRQVGEANRHVVVSCALLAGTEPPAFSNQEPDFPELKGRIATVIAFMQTLDPAVIDAAADKAVVFTFRNGATKPFTGKSLLLTFSVPQFFFHVTAAYDILRLNGVDVTKNNFLWALK
jgi:uncharacterized protein